MDISEAAGKCEKYVQRAVDRKVSYYGVLAIEAVFAPIYIMNLFGEIVDCI